MKLNDLIKTTYLVDYRNGTQNQQSDAEDCLPNDCNALSQK